MLGSRRPRWSGRCLSAGRLGVECCDHFVAIATPFGEHAQRLAATRAKHRPSLGATLSCVSFAASPRSGGASFVRAPRKPVHTMETQLSLGVQILAVALLLAAAVVSAILINSN
jgi:hypothetical protein